MKVLHILFWDRPLNTFPSVYNAVYLWYKYGFENHIAMPSNCFDFEEYIHRHYQLKGSVFNKINCISNIEYFFDIVIVYSTRDLELFYLAQLKKHLKYRLLLLLLQYKYNLTRYPEQRQ